MAIAEIGQATAESWLHTLEALGIVFLLRPCSNHVLKRTVSTPKLYFYDTGLLKPPASPEVLTFPKFC